jgi:hypothetical protein
VEGIVVGCGNSVVLVVGDVVGVVHTVVVVVPPGEVVGGTLVGGNDVDVETEVVGGTAVDVVGGRVVGGTEVVVEGTGRVVVVPERVGRHWRM